MPHSVPRVLFVPSWVISWVIERFTRPLKPTKLEALSSHAGMDACRASGDGMRDAQEAEPPSTEARFVDDYIDETGDRRISICEGSDDGRYEHGLPSDWFSLRKLWLFTGPGFLMSIAYLVRLLSQDDSSALSVAFTFNALPVEARYSPRLLIIGDNGSRALSVDIRRGFQQFAVFSAPCSRLCRIQETWRETCKLEPTRGTGYAGFYSAALQQ